MDGDYPGIQVVMDTFKVVFAAIWGITFLKWCAACSLLYQPNDLQVCFMEIRRYLKSKLYEEDKRKNLPPPRWLNKVTPFLQKHKFDKGSIDTYIKCIPFVWLAMEKTYTRKNVMDGWLRSKIRNPLAIVDACPPVMKMKKEKRDEFVRKVVDLAADDFGNGMCTDEDMINAGIDKFFDASTIKQTTGKPLNQQRSMVLTSDEAFSYRKQLVEAALTKKKTIEAKKQTANLVKSAKEVAQDNAIDGPPPATIFMCTRATCKPKTMDGAWKGCPVPGCLAWYCLGSITCVNESTGHFSKHLAHVVGNK